METLAFYGLGAIAFFFLILYLIIAVPTSIFSWYEKSKYRAFCAKRRAFERDFMKRCEL